MTIEVINWKQFSDISINQGSNSIYIEQEHLPALIAALQKYAE